MELSEMQIVVGLDIGTTKIACIVGRKNEHGKVEIIGYGRHESIGVTRGVVSNINHTVESISRAVTQAMETSGVEVEVVNVGIAGKHIKSLQHRGIHTRESMEGEIEQSDIEKLVDDMHKLNMPPGEEIIHVLPQEYIVDDEQGIKDPIGNAGRRLEANFHVITGQVVQIKNMQKCVARADLDIENLVLEPLASADAVLSEDEKEAGVVLVDIGGGTTDIAIFQDGIIRHTAVIPFGGNVVTEDIKQGCTILKQQAELLKIKFGSALPMDSMENDIVCIPGLKGRDPKEISIKNLAHIIQARMEEIVEHVIYEIHNSGFESQLIAGIVVTGGGAQLKHVNQLFEYRTGKDTRVGYPSEHLAQTHDQDQLISTPAFATGVGLVLKGFENQPQRKPQEVRTTRKKREGLLDRLLKKGANWLEGDDVE